MNSAALPGADKSEDRRRPKTELWYSAIVILKIHFFCWKNVFVAERWSVLSGKTLHACAEEGLQWATWCKFAMYEEHSDQNKHLSFTQHRLRKQVLLIESEPAAGRLFQKTNGVYAQRNWGEVIMTANHLFSINICTHETEAESCEASSPHVYSDDLMHREY